MATTEVAHTLEGQYVVQGTLHATDSCVTLPRLIFASAAVGVQISGTWSGTCTFEGSLDLTNWSAMGMLALPTQAGITSTATANGMWTGWLQGVSEIRVRFSTASSGSPVVTIRSFPFTK